jgi:hypothetical protein
MSAQRFDDAFLIVGGLLFAGLAAVVQVFPKARNSYQWLLRSLAWSICGIVAGFVTGVVLLGFWLIETALAFAITQATPDVQLGSAQIIASLRAVGSLTGFAAGIGVLLGILAGPMEWTTHAVRRHLPHGLLGLLVARRNRLLLIITIMFIGIVTLLAATNESGAVRSLQPLVIGFAVCAGAWIDVPDSIVGTRRRWLTLILGIVLFVGIVLCLHFIRISPSITAIVTPLLVLGSVASSYLFVGWLLLNRGWRPARQSLTRSSSIRLARIRLWARSSAGIVIGLGLMKFAQIVGPSSIDLESVACALGFAVVAASRDVKSLLNTPRERIVVGYVPVAGSAQGEIDPGKHGASSAMRWDFTRHVFDRGVARRRFWNTLWVLVSVCYVAVFLYAYDWVLTRKELALPEAAQGHLEVVFTVIVLPVVIGVVVGIVVGLLNAYRYLVLNKLISVAQSGHELLGLAIVLLGLIIVAIPALLRYVTGSG